MISVFFFYDDGKTLDPRCDGSVCYLNSLKARSCSCVKVGAVDVFFLAAKVLTEFNNRRI